nr:invasion associated locus B family protein [Sphingomonas sp. BGYR3]
MKTTEWPFRGRIGPEITRKSVAFSGLILVGVLAAGGTATARNVIGVYGAWGAFSDAMPRRCYAMARPLERGGAAFAAIANWPGERIRHQLHLRLSRPRSERAPVTLAVGERRFVLMAGPSDAWSPDAATDQAIVTAMRSARSMTVETIAANGRPFVDSYALNGAAAAIDAARLGCGTAPRR